MRLWENYFAMVLLGLVLGIATGGFPAYAREASTAALVFAMTFSLTEVRFQGISGRAEFRSFARALALNYGLLTSVILGLSVLYPDPAIRRGWVVMAAVPSAVAVVPITSALKGNVRSALVSSAFLYVAALAAFPLITFGFAGQAANPVDVGVQILLQIGLPLAASRSLAGRPAVTRHRPVLVNVSFFVLVFALAGANRSVFVQTPTLVLSLVGGGFLRTWAVGLAILAVTRWRGFAREERLTDALFGTLKNLGLAALLGFSLFGAAAALPAIVSLFFEIAWVLALSRFLAA